MWAHHYRKGPSGSAEYADRVSRWKGPGNMEFRNNIAAAFAEKKPVRLVLASTDDAKHVESGKDASKIKKEFHVREELIGEVVEFDGDNYVLRFVQVPKK